MASPARRHERRADELQALFEVRRTVDLSPWETQGRYLEGTGSLVLDRTHRTAYAGLSSRTDPDVVTAFCTELGFRPIVFPTEYRGAPVYHTNVMMSIGETFVVVDANCVPDPTARDALMSSLRATGRELIELGAGQIAGFAANILQIALKDGKSGIVMSETGLHALMGAQRRVLESHGTLIPLPIGAIEESGGGSARCMLAEIFLPDRLPRSSNNASN